MAKWDDFASSWDETTTTWDESTALTFEPRIDINAAGVWTDITDYVYYRDSVKITQGQQDETSVVQPGTCRFTLNNRDGRFSPRNPTSPYYGQIGRNTPVRVSMLTSSSYLWAPGEQSACLQTPDSASLSVTGDLDLRAEVNLENWNPAGANTVGIAPKSTIASKYAATGNEGSWLFAIHGTGQMRFSWSTDGTSGGAFFVTSPNSITVPGSGKLAVRVTLDVNNGLGGWTVTFYTSDSIGGTWTQLFQYVYTGGTTNIFDSTAPVQFGSVTDLDFSTFGYGPCLGKMMKFQMYNGIAGTKVADVDLTAQAEGTTTYTDANSNVWTTQGNATILAREFRFFGEVSSWPSTWDTGGFDVYVPIVANGILRRLGQGQRPLQSTLRRRIPAYSPLAYWPMEDGSVATQGANAVSGGPVMNTTNFSFASNSTLPGSAPLPTINSSSGYTFYYGFVPAPSGSPTGFTAAILYYIGAGSATQRTYLEFDTNGTGANWSVRSGTGGSTVQILAADGSTLVSTAIGTGTDIFGQWIELTLSGSVSGGTVTWRVTWTKLSGVGGTSSGTFSGSLGHITAIRSPFSGISSDLNGMSIGHIAAFSTSSTTAYNGAFDGWAGEYAADRLSRLAVEESVQISCFGEVDTEQKVGPQPQNTLLDVSQAAADADGGILYERRTLTGLGFRDLDSLGAQSAVLSLPYSSNALIAPLQPSGDDFLIRNDVTVTRTNGSSATQTDTTSALSVNDPPNGVGDYSTQYTLNLFDDSELDSIAYWKMHVGTWDEERYPTVNIAVHNDTSITTNVLDLGVGDRLTITSPPSWLPPSDIDLIVIGYSEVFDQFTWYVTYTCVPYGPYRLGVADASDSTADTDGSTLHASATSTATSITVDTQTDSARWVDSATYASDFPFDIMVGGERMTVTAVTGTSNPQTFTVTRSVNGVVKAQTSGTAVSLWTENFAGF